MELLIALLVFGVGMINYGIGYHHGRLNAADEVRIEKGKAWDDGWAIGREPSSTHIEDQNPYWKKP